MRRVRGYHVKWAFSAFIGGLVVYSGYRQYFIGTPGGKFEAYLAFIEKADVVHLYTTTDPWQGAADPDAQKELPSTLSAADQELYTANRVRKDVTYDKTSGVAIAQFLRDLKVGTAKPKSEIQPHHFVLASKGDKKIEIDISFQSKLLHCSGDLPTITFALGESAVREQIAELFGGDIFPQLEQIDKIMSQRKP